MHATRWMWVVPVVGGAVVPNSDAVVENITAEVRSEVQVFVDDAAGSSDEAIENFGDTGLVPPITARADLESMDDAGDAVGQGIAVADFFDPTQSGPQRNPGEIAIEADCYSNDPATRYVLSSSVVESRTVSLSAAELGNPSLGQQSVSSAVFMSGAIFAWSVDAGRDLTGLSGEVTFTVRRVDRDAGGAIASETTLVDGRVTLRGGPNGTFTLDSPEDLFVFVGGVDILPDDDSDTAGLPSADFGTLGATQVAVILEQDLAYGYEATAGEEFDLEAAFTTNVANLPDGTGVVAVFGRGFEDAFGVVELGVPEQTAKSLQTRLNRAIAEFKQPAGFRITGGASPCGLLGFELFPFLGLLASLRFLAPLHKPASRPKNRKEQSQR